ncbi:SDR family oxidoreductase [Spirosoma sp. KUDC1026]|uniref:SDR family oxidoreductase n=1 Tax=Spirosoma sp. KUDC1026 TaxID=2745947 RepID=UPI00159B91FA|nr:SDR family oxidoreductase [Spirosoma sp. KUDC1026]QKZ12111.1 SDR family oxidoreductase [Spirosoma sp. KUDC1026]
MNLDLTGKTALVCGSTQGIGRASAVELALLGTNVVLMARNEEKLQETISGLDTSRGQAHRYIVADFAEASAVSDAISKHLASYPDMHILINNTGGPAGGPLIDAQADAFVQTFHNHLLNNQALVQAVVPAMKKAGYGRIVNIISTSVKQPIVGLGVSNTIRGAVAQWSKTLSLEIAQFGITVNNVLPGYTRTARLDSVLSMRAKSTGKTEEEVTTQMQQEIPTGRFVEPEEVGAAVAFLCTPAAASINGINVPVDGGRTGSL